MEQIRMLLIDSPLLNIPAPEGYAVRPAVRDRVSDAAAWERACRILNDSIGTRMEFYKDMIGDPEVGWSNIYFICRKEDGMVCGTATAKIGPGSSLHMVGMDEPFMGLGLSAPVCAAAVDRMTREGISRIKLLTDEFRIPAIRTYLKLGFRPWYFMDDMPGRWRGVFDDMGIPYDRYTAWNEAGTERIPVC